ncbi:unnamed protein product [Prorocentrum cordatum]|uniref:Uncharacterized protein n=1 Tax=Prorocentrum cordatum TaxID=2364126 RepID=A0ABN9PDA4_9DINO|nr:unnamed protein product [Polarella glacialis]
MLLPASVSDLLQTAAREIGRGAVAGVVASWTVAGGGGEACPPPGPCPLVPPCPNLTCPSPEFVCPQAPCPPRPGLSCPEGPPWVVLALVLVGNVAASVSCGFLFGVRRGGQHGGAAGNPARRPALRGGRGGGVIGSRIFVRYADAGGDLPHERVCLWPLTEVEWITESPGGEQVAEELVDGDIEEFVVLAPGGVVPAHVTSPRYRFREEVGPRALRLKMMEAKQVARAATRPGDSVVEATPFAQLWGGQVAALEDLWRGGGVVPPPRRVRTQAAGGFGRRRATRS